ncbi:hypothetical protein DEO72_LG4g1400 [Vigna unguiculata]|uniref:Uncharacterized protein n=1 Tax=Vigna unguiculata TaxID=3917 RepID=A0A4D6LR24_VIGUN|nr:hypothetical protein DEO72_LG4g1400 [Vigna unguiculata]
MYISLITHSNPATPIFPHWTRTTLILAHPHRSFEQENVAAAGILVSLSASGAGVSLDGGGEVVRRETIATGWQRVNTRSSTGKESSRRRGSWHRGRSASVAAAAALMVVAAGVAAMASGRRSAPPVSRASEKKGRSEGETMTSAGSSVDGGRCRRRHSRTAGRASQGRSRVLGGSREGCRRWWSEEKGD